MTTLYRYRTALTGFTGGPGVSTMYFLDQQTALTSLRKFWEAVAQTMPSTVGIQCENTGDVIESTSGALTGSWVKEAVLPSVGVNPGAYSAPSGACITWLTDVVVDRRRLKGRTFVVPLTNFAYQTNGTLTPEIIYQLQQAAQALVFEQMASIVVWHRPRAAVPATPTSPALAARLGSHALITGNRVTDKAAVLRSRRD